MSVNKKDMFPQYWDKMIDVSVSKSRPRTWREVVVVVVVVITVIGVIF